MYRGQEMCAAQNDIINQKTCPENVKTTLILGINSRILIYCIFLFIVLTFLSILLTRKYEIVRLEELVEEISLTPGL